MAPTGAAAACLAPADVSVLSDPEIVSYICLVWLAFIAIHLGCRN